MKRSISLMKKLRDFLNGNLTKILQTSNSNYSQRLVKGNLMIIREIDKDDAEYFIKQYHYSKIMPRLTKHYLGFYDESVDKGTTLLGVVTLGWGTQPLQTIKKIFYKHEMKTVDYLEIGKMCFAPMMNDTQYFGSRVCSSLVTWVKQNTTCKFLYTLADGIMGKCGYVYQASNFRYIGSFKTSVYYDTKTGEKIHPRSAKSLCKENALMVGKKVFWLTDEFCKQKGIDKIQGKMFRYIYPLNKEGKKILKQYPEYNNLPYPKEKDLLFERRAERGKFEPIPMPQFNMNVFNYNYQNNNEEQLRIAL